MHVGRQSGCLPKSLTYCTQTATYAGLSRYCSSLRNSFAHRSTISSSCVPWLLGKLWSVQLIYLRRPWCQFPRAVSDTRGLTCATKPAGSTHLGHGQSNPQSSCGQARVLPLVFDCVLVSHFFCCCRACISAELPTAARPLLRAPTRLPLRRGLTFSFESSHSSAWINVVRLIGSFKLHEVSSPLATCMMPHTRGCFDPNPAKK